VNTTSLGMVHHQPLEISLAASNPHLAVADIVYAPLETELLQTARAHNLLAVEGLGMLLHQAVPGFTAWFGVAPTVDAELYRIVSGA
jgi:shikimate dehydrogenase